jgi:hypothetical protein
MGEFDRMATGAPRGSIFLLKGWKAEKLRNSNSCFPWRKGLGIDLASSLLFETV